MKSNRTRRTPKIKVNQSSSYSAGQQAFNVGCDLGDNPYLQGSLRYNEWHDGWCYEWRIHWHTPLFVK